MKSIFCCGLLLALLPVAVQARLNVVASLPDYAAIAEAIGGDLVEVTAIARGTEDQHFVDAKPSYVRVLNRADVLIEGGAELEIGWLPALVSGARNPRILADAPGHVVVARGVALRDVPAGPIDRSMGDVHPLGNPHFSLDPANGKIIAASIAAAFSQVDPSHASDYAARLAAFNSRLDAKLAEWADRMRPFRGTRVITYHRSFDYLLDRFGLVLAGTLEPKPGVEPSPTHITALVGRGRQDGVKLVIIEPFRPRKVAEDVAAKIGAKVVVLAGSVGATPKVRDYVELFDYDVGLLAEALKP